MIGYALMGMVKVTWPVIKMYSSLLTKMVKRNIITQNNKSERKIEANNLTRQICSSNYIFGIGKARHLKFRVLIDTLEY